jgi:hypothetical protein
MNRYLEIATKYSKSGGDHYPNDDNNHSLSFWVKFKLRKGFPDEISIAVDLFAAPTIYSSMSWEGIFILPQFTL